MWQGTVVLPGAASLAMRQELALPQNTVKLDSEATYVPSSARMGTICEGASSRKSSEVAIATMRCFSSSLRLFAGLPRGPCRASPRVQSLPQRW